MTSTPRKPRQPRLKAVSQFGPAGSALVARLMEAYDFSASPEKYELVMHVGKTADLVQRLSDFVESSESLRCAGTTGKGAVPIPELTELRQYRNQLQGLIKSLGLPDEEEDSVDESGGRRPMSRQQSSRIANAARWKNQRSG